MTAGPNHDETLRELRRVVGWMDTVLAHLDEGVAVAEGPEKRLIFVNEVFARMVGQDRIFMLGRPLSSFITVHEAVRLPDEGVPAAGRPGEESRRYGFSAELAAGLRPIKVKLVRLSEPAGQSVIIVRDPTLE